MKKTGKLILILAVHLLGLSAAQGQTNGSHEIVPLNVGDKCPDFEFSNIINGKASSFKLSDLKGKLVIIDFWATWCGPCIEALPKMDSLQKKFGDKIAILPVTWQTKEKVKTEMGNSIILGSVSLPFITGNTEIRKYFPFRSIPHEIWIDQQGYVKSITSHEHVTAKNITSLLQGENIHLPQKKEITDTDYRKPLLLGGIGQTYTLNPQSLKYSSVIIEYIEALPGQEGGPEIGKNYSKILSTNSTIEGLYRSAFATSSGPLKGPRNPNFFFRLPSRTVWEANNIRDGYSYDLAQKRFPKPENSFSYELIVPREDSAKLNQFAVEDLNRYFGMRFGIEGVKEKRKVKCWVLSRTTDKDLLKSRGGEPLYDLLEERNIIRIRNTTINELLFYWLNKCLYIYPTPVIDETNYKAPVDLEINADLKNIQAVSESLKKYGLTFKLTDRELDMIVIRDKK